MIFDWFRRHSNKPDPLVSHFNSTKIPTTKPARDYPLLAFDIETTGLNARRDHIVSIGWIPIRAQEIVLADARHYLVKSSVSVGQSAAVHGLLDRDLENGRTIHAVLTELFSTYAGYVFVAHHATLDQLFLQAAARHCFGAAPHFCFLDTLAIERYRLQRQGIVVKNDALQLPTCLKRHGLPDGLPHSALEDAYGCALLLMAQIGRSNFSLADLLRQTRI